MPEKAFEHPQLPESVLDLWLNLPATRKLLLEGTEELYKYIVDVLLHKYQEMRDGGSPTFDEGIYKIRPVGLCGGLWPALSLAPF